MSTLRSVDQLTADSADEPLASEARDALLICAARSVHGNGGSPHASVGALAKLFVHHFSGFLMTVRDYYPTDEDPIPFAWHPEHQWFSADDMHCHLHTMLLSSACLVMESQLLQNSGASKEAVIHQIRRAQNELLRDIHSKYDLKNENVTGRCNKVGFSRLLAPEDFYDSITQNRLPALILTRLKSAIKDPEMGITRSLDFLKEPLDYALTNPWFFSLHAQDPAPPHVPGMPNLSARRRALLTTLPKAVMS